MSDQVKVIVDCDPGTDDAMALMMLLADEKIKIMAITSCEGNTNVANATKNILRILRLCNRLDIPVYQGADRSILNTSVPHDGLYCGQDGMGDAPDESQVDLSLVKSEFAVNAILRIVNENLGEIVLVALAPLTNVAIALKLDPILGSKLKDFVIMGGNIEGKGNIHTGVEFNFYCDPEAAHIVLSQMNRKVKIVPLEIGWKYAFSWEWYQKFISIPTAKAQYFKRIDNHTASYLRTDLKNPIYGNIYDQLAVAFVQDPSVVKATKSVYVTVELASPITRGQMIVDWRGHLHKEANAELFTEFDQEKFAKLIYKSMDYDGFIPI